jgi:spermidine synthase
MPNSALLSATPASTPPRWLLYAVSFSGGFQIMVLEMCGFRVLQTNFGSSVVVTGTLLTLIMVLLSAGYSLGGLLSKRFGGARQLFGLLMIAAVYSEIATRLLMVPLGKLGLDLYDALEGSPFLQTGLPTALQTFVLYGPPVLLISMISPFLIRLRTQHEQGADAGVASGFFMSMSTIGSIAGTMLSSYVSIPFYGVEAAASASNVVFLVLVSFGFIRESGSLARAVRLRAIGALVLAAACVLSLRFVEHEPNPNVLYQAESHYGQLSVVREQDEAGREVIVYYPSQVYTHSMLYPTDPLRELGALMFLVPALLRPPKNILVLGSAAGGIVRKIEQVFPNAKITGVDLDPQVHEVALNVFGVNPQQTRLVARDARIFVRQETETYDFIIVDLFSGEFIPTHCITREFFELVRARLAPGAGMFVNTNMNDIYQELPESLEPFRGIRNLEHTLRAAGFPALFENSFFHSLIAFPSPVSSNELRRGLLGWFDDARNPPPLRVGAAVAAYTTTEVPADRERYRVFTDHWTPGVLIERKSNEQAIYSALAEAHEGNPDGSASSADVSAIVLEQRLAAWRRSGDGSLLDMPALLRALANLGGTPQAADWEVAARHFRFTPEVGTVQIPEQGHWAKLAAFHSELQRLGSTNDYEALLPVVEQLRNYMPVAN